MVYRNNLVDLRPTSTFVLAVAFLVLLVGWPLGIYLEWTNFNVRRHHGSWYGTQAGS